MTNATQTREAEKERPAGFANLRVLQAASERLTADLHVGGAAVGIMDRLHAFLPMALETWPQLDRDERAEAVRLINVVAHEWIARNETALVIPDSRERDAGFSGRDTLAGSRGTQSVVQAGALRNAPTRPSSDARKPLQKRRRANFATLVELVFHIVRNTDD